MIINVTRDIFKQESDAIIHQCNCFGVMGGGIAATIRKNYPEASKADTDTKCGDKAKMGHYSCVKAHDGKYIYNLYSQYRYGNDARHTNYESFYTGLNAIKGHMINIELNTASLPWGIGCGLGGGSWNIINAIIEDIFSESPIVLYICKYNPK